jgi:RNA polymerase sigma-70 factor, ECF subfamily
LVIVGRLHDEPRSGGLRPELVIRAQSGDREAFDALATASYDRLYSIGRRILRDASAAEDAVQEALIRCWRDLRSLRDPDRFEAWTHRLLVNACYDQARSRRRLDRDVTDIAAERADPADDYATIVQRDELERLFLRLPIEHRAAIVLTHYLGLSALEAAQVLGVPAGTVYSRVHYGLRTMRGGLDPTLPVGTAAATSGKGR